MISRFTDIKHGKIVGCLTGRCQHRGDTALKVADLRGDVIVCGVLKACIEISGFLQIKKASHLLGRRILEGRALHNRHDTGLPVFRRISGLNTFGFQLIRTHAISSLSNLAQDVWQRLNGRFIIAPFVKISYEWKRSGPRKNDGRHDSFRLVKTMGGTILFAPPTGIP